MTILEKNDQVALRALFDHDKTDVFQKFMGLLKQRILEKPGVGTSEYETLLMSITREAQKDAIDLILEQLNQEIGNMEVEE